MSNKRLFCKECYRYVDTETHCGYKTKLESVFKNGDFVRLKKKSINDFYGKSDHVDFYTIRGELSSESFLDFVEDYLGFYNGKRYGYVDGEGCTNGTYKVRFFCNETGRWKFGFFVAVELTGCDL